jgi:hypothetical protein
MKTIIDQTIRSFALAVYAEPVRTAVRVTFPTGRCHIPSKMKG